MIAYTGRMDVLTQMGVTIAYAHLGRAVTVENMEVDVLMI